MSRTTRLHCLALLLPLWAAHAEPAPDERTARRSDETGLELRLADGSVLRVPFNAAGKRLNGRVDHTASDDLAADPRRKSPRRRVEVFDRETPGAIASVRG